MLNAKKFVLSRKVYEVGFREILIHIIEAYKLLIEDNDKVQNDENNIRDILIEHYLNNPIKREQLGIESLIFNREPSENMDKGFIDIKVQTMISLNNPQAYYIFECKRLDGTGDLNRKYIKEGIMRFIDKKYSSYYGLNGMLGFKVKMFNTHVNIDNLNDLALFTYPQTNIVGKITNISIIKEFAFSYVSQHKTTDFSGVIELYHLMLDFHTIL